MGNIAKLENTENIPTGSPIPLDKLIDNYTLLDRFRANDLWDTSDLWIPIALEQLFHLNKISLIEDLLQAIEFRISPYRTSRCRLDYSVSHKMDEAANPLISSFGDFINFQVDIKIRNFQIYISVNCNPKILEVPPFEEDDSEFLSQLKTSVININYVTSPSYIDWQDLVKLEKIPLIEYFMDVFNSPSKRISDINRMKRVFIRRNGLVTGKIETLEEIAVDEGGVTRERIRQIESQANKVVQTRVNRNQHLKTSLRFFREYVQDNILRENGILESKELSDFLGNSIDFKNYDPEQSTVVLSRYAKLFIQRSRSGNQKSLITFSKTEYEKFNKLYKIISGVDLYEQESHVEFNYELFKALRLVLRYLDESEIHRIRENALSIIGSSKVMMYDHFISNIVPYDVKKCINEYNPENVSKSEHMIENLYSSICTVANVSIFPCAEFERIVCGRWVYYDLTKASLNIARAILYSGIDLQNRVTKNEYLRELKKGKTLEEITRYFQIHLGELQTEHAIDATCKRFPNIFIATGSQRWGLIGAGSALWANNEVTDSDNVKITDCITNLLMKYREMSLDDLVQEVRRLVPNASAYTISLYVNTTHTERFTANQNGKYRLTDRYLDYLINPKEQLPTIDILMKTMEESEEPLDVKEIIKRCEEKGFVSHSALRTYLVQNYKGRFLRLDNGRYILSSE